MVVATASSTHAPGSEIPYPAWRPEDRRADPWFGYTVALDNSGEIVAVAQ